MNEILKIKNRITLLRSRKGNDNVAIIRKLERKLRKLQEAAL